MARMIDADTLRSNIDCCDIETYNWLVIGSEYASENDPRDMTTFYTYKCRRCGKTKRTWEILRVYDGGADNPNCGAKMDGGNASQK